MYTWRLPEVFIMEVWLGRYIFEVVIKMLKQGERRYCTFQVMYITWHVNRYVDNEPRKHGFNYLFEVNLPENLTFIFPLFLLFKCTKHEGISFMYTWRLPEVFIMEVWLGRYIFEVVIKMLKQGERRYCTFQLNKNLL
jgi:hypothetical protein